MALNSFFSGLSGLSAQSAAINVIGDNLANVNTVAFKGSNVRFADLVDSGVTSASGNPQQQGLGVRVATITPDFEQGTLQRTDNPLDLAVDGDGFFLTAADDGTRFTRAGDFLLAADGSLMSSSGDPVLGWTDRLPDGTISGGGPLGPISIPPDRSIPPQATTELTLGFNLDAGADVTDRFITSAIVHDSLGENHVIDFTFTKTAASSWTYNASIDGSSLAGGTPGAAVSLANGTLQFDADGMLDAAVGVDGAPPADVAITAATTMANGAAALDFDWDLLLDDGTSPASGVSSDSVVRTAHQDGYAAGSLSGLHVSPDGALVGRFTNGESLELGRLAVATFSNPEGLLRLGGNSYASTRASGQAVIGKAGAGGRGKVIGGTLEMSNVDVAEQFTALILAQRGYQANSRMITTSDEVTQEAINLKR